MQRVLIRHVALGIGLSLLVAGGYVSAGGEDARARADAPATRLVEIRSYNLKPESRDRFHRLVLREALPMLQRWKVDVIAFGPSLHDADSYFLMRGFSSIAERQKSEDAFYGSDEWKKGPREAVLADIVSYTTIVVSLNEAAIAGLRVTSAAR